jgi:hypothetical protein
MYCVKCGVELSDSEKRCPLCGTIVYHPYVKQGIAEKPYPEPERAPDIVKPKGLLFLFTVFFTMALVITVLCDWPVNGSITWSGVAGSAIICGYIIIALPIWFKKPNPVIFVPIDFAFIGGMLLYINFHTDGHWFMTLAFPATCMAMIIVTAVIALIKYLRRGYLFIFGGAFIAIGGSMMLLEFFLNLTFKLHDTFIWSIYPLAACAIIGLTLIIIGICKPLRESLHRKIFI